MYSPPAIVTVEQALRHSTPAIRQPPAVQDWKERNLPNIARGIDDLARGVGPIGKLWAALLRPAHEPVPLGLVSLRVVTTAGVAWLVDCMQGSVEPETMRYHAIGTGSTVEAVGQTALAAELITQYAINSTRPQGTLGEGSSANVFRTTASTLVDVDTSVTEWGLFDQPAAPGGVMFDRTVFAALGLKAGEAIAWTYDCTIPPGG